VQEEPAEEHVHGEVPVQEELGQGRRKLDDDFHVNDD
jgi:hypothetical protein